MPARDETYQTKAYRPQGGAEYVVQASTANVTALSTAGMTFAGSIGTTVANGLAGIGLSVIRCTTGGGAQKFHLAGPSDNGAVKMICCVGANSSDTVTVSTTASGLKFFDDVSTSKDLIVFTASPSGVLLTALGSTTWCPIAFFGTTAATPTLSS